MSQRVVVVGSVNMDLLLQCEHLPRPGETRIASNLQQVSGGKGANQAVAAARCGAEVSMVGCVGDDAYGRQLEKNLVKEGVDCQFVRRLTDTPSGLAIVAVEASGENSIIAVQGANAQVAVDDVLAAERAIFESDTLLLQLEIPTEASIAAIEVARRANAKVILDPAPPIGRVPCELLRVDVVTPNLSEAEVLLDRNIEGRDAAEKAVKDLLDLGCQSAIITLGSGGAVYAVGTKVGFVPALNVHAVDTTAAGDAFAGCLARSWGKEVTLQDAIPYANAGGAVAASRLGAQPSLPDSEAIFRLINSQPTA